MQWNKQVIIGALVVLSVAAVPTATAPAHGKAPRQLGLGVVVDSRWIAVEGYYSVRDGGAAARNPAWVGGAPSRVTSQIRTVRLGVAPNVIGRVRQKFVVVRALGHAAYAVVCHFLRNAEPSDSATNESIGDRDADRR